MMNQARYRRPAGFDAKAETVRRQIVASRLKGAGLPAHLVQFLEASSDAIAALDDATIDTLQYMTTEQRCAAVGMKAESHSALEVAQYLVTVARRKIATDEAQHAANLKPLTPATRTVKPIPPLKLGATMASDTASVSLSTPRTNRAQTPTMQGTPRTAVSSGASPARYTSAAPSTPGRQRPPGLRDSSFYREACHELKLHRQESATRTLNERQRLTARQHYHRERSRSPTGSVTSATAGRNTTPPRERPVLWEPKRRAELQPTSVEARQLRNTFGESSHRVSYLPRELQSEAFRLAAKQGVHSDFISAFQKFERTPTKKASVAPPVMTRATPRGADRTTESPPSTAPPPKPQPPQSTTAAAPLVTPSGASPPPPLASPRLSDERAQRLLADFRAILESNGTRPEAFAKLNADQQNAAFDEWRCPHTMRLVVRDAYQRVGGDRSPR